jgi:hypothetical protein
MPFRLDDENQTAAQATTAAPNISGVSTGIEMNVPSGKGKAAPQKSGQFQNIQQYLQANQPQAQQMAGKVAGQVETAATEAQKAGEQLASEAPKVGEYKPVEILGQVTQGTAAPTAQEQYTKTRQTGGYEGPQDVTGLGSYAQEQQKAAKAQEAVQAAQTETGQRGLLQQAYGRAGYGGQSGQNILDQALFAQSQAGRETISGLGQKYAGLADVLKGYETQAGQQLKASQEQAAKNIAAFAPAETAARTGIISPIEQRAAEANKQLEYQAAAEDLQDLQLSPETMAMLGLTEGQRVYNANLGSFIGAPTAQATVQNIATEQERQKYNDLMNFIGANPQDLALGQATYKPVEVKQQDLANELAARQEEFNKRQADVSSVLNPLNAMLNKYGWQGQTIGGISPELIKGANTYEGLKNLYQSVYDYENNPQMSYSGALWNIAHGGSAPSEWNWDAGTTARTRQSYSWIPAMEAKLAELKGLGAENTIKSNLQPSGVRMKIKPGGV